MKRRNVWAALGKLKEMKRNSNRPNGVVMTVFCISSRWIGIWLCSRQVDSGEDGKTEKLVGVVMDMLDGEAVGTGTGVECSEIATHCST
jgi:hypothetical protein